MVRGGSGGSIKESVEHFDFGTTVSTKLVERAEDVQEGGVEGGERVRGMGVGSRGGGRGEWSGR